MSYDSYDVLVIGAGPAGLTASIYGARSGLRIAILERAMPGGYMATTDLIENYPGFPEGIKGFELAQKMKQHALRFGVDIISEEAKTVTKSKHRVIVETSSNQYEVPAIIIATGTMPKKLNIPGEDELRGRGVSYCATCDGPLYKDRIIAVIGCGNSGLQEGHFLLNFVKEIIFVEFLPHITADKILQDKFEGEKRITFLLNHKLMSINGKDRVGSITVKNQENETEITMEVDGVFIYSGQIPASKFLRDVVDLDDNGFVITNEKLETSVPGIFAAGDIRSKEIRQVVTACSEGAEAVINAYHYIQSVKKY